MSSPLKEHWNRVYSTREIHRLGWYEPESTPSIRLIERCSLDPDCKILDVGSGATTLIGSLLSRGYRNITALDISEVALEKARERLGEPLASQVHWIVDDMTNPSVALDLSDVAIWHDRAVFHFLTEEPQRQAYLSVLRKALMPGGFVIMAAFAVGGATRCSGLQVQNYDASTLSRMLGPDFELVESLDYTYHMPSGDIRPYIYVLFRGNSFSRNPHQ